MVPMERYDDPVDRYAKRMKWKVVGTTTCLTTIQMILDGEAVVSDAV